VSTVADQIAQSFRYPGPADDTSIQKGHYPLYCDNPTVVTRLVQTGPDDTVLTHWNDITVLAAAFKRPSWTSMMGKTLLRKLRTFASYLGAVAVITFLMFFPVLDVVRKVRSFNRGDYIMLSVMTIFLVGSIFAVATLHDTITHFPVIDSMLHHPAVQHPSQPHNRG
jgi:hypothetical protein